MKTRFIEIAALALMAVSCTYQAKIPSEYAGEPALNIISGKTVVFEAGGGSIDVVFDTDQLLIVSASGNWLKTSVNANVATLTATENTNITTRYSELIAVSGDRTCKLMVQQAGFPTIFTVRDSWGIDVSVSDDYNVTVNITDSGASGTYYSAIVSEESLKESGASGNLSLFLSLNNNAFVMKQGKTVSQGNTTVDAGVLGRGKYYAFVVGLDGSQVNYTYQVAPFRVMYPYDRWLGVWSAKTADGSSETWTIEQNVLDESYLIYGVAGGDELPTLAVYDSETGGFSVSEQENVGKQMLGGEECDMSLYGCILYNGGHPYWGDGLEIFTTTLGEDWESGTVAAGKVNATYGNFVGYAYYGAVDGEVAYWLGYKDLPVNLILEKR